MRAKINGIEGHVYKTKPPKMKHCFGRTWDEITISVNNKLATGFVDTTWGAYIYFIYYNNWYKFRWTDYSISLNTFKIEMKSKKNDRSNLKGDQNERN